MKKLIHFEVIIEIFLFLIAFKISKSLNIFKLNIKNNFLFFIKYFPFHKIQPNAKK